MNWIFLGLLMGATVTSNHDTREACEGRAVMLREKGVVGDCRQAPGITGVTSYGGPTRAWDRHIDAPPGSLIPESDSQKRR